MTSIDSEPATGDLTVWAMGNEGDLLGDFVEGFKEENPDVNITVTAIPWASAHDKIQTAIAAGTVPDVIQMGTTWMADFADAFAPVPENFDLSDFSAGPLEAGQVNGEQLGVPWYVDSHVLYYRTDIAEQAGWDHAPETLDELKQMAADVKQVDGVENGMYISPSGENGIATANDARRIDYTYDALAGLHDAMSDGIDVLGYLHWSLLDNYEWGSFRPTFGLIGWDKDTFERHPRPSLDWLGNVSRSGVLSHPSR